MPGRVELRMSIEQRDAEALLQSTDRRLQVLRNCVDSEGSERWVASMRERMTLSLFKEELETALLGETTAERDAEAFRPQTQTSRGRAFL